MAAIQNCKMIGHLKKCTAGMAAVMLMDVCIIAECAESWPGGSSVADACEKGEFEDNLSGIYVGKDAISSWAVQNSGFLYKLGLNAMGLWLMPSEGDWGSGKQILFPDGTGIPDAEDIAMTDDPELVYVCTERDDSSGNSKTSRLSILNYDITSNDTKLVALNEWKLNKYLPQTDSNLGLEALTWVPDSYLTAHNFIDESKDSTYSPGNYPNHGNGLFFVGMESDGKVYVFALNHNSGEASFLTDFKTEHNSVMALHFDSDVNYLWTHCDDTCNGQQEVYTLVNGKFESQAVFDRPSGMANYNNEGFTTTPESACVDGLKPVYWTDDTNDGNVAIRSGTVDCGNFLGI